MNLKIETELLVETLKTLQHSIRRFPECPSNTLSTSQENEGTRITLK
jgi:hypothetical protein